jgi:hypothetical protein
VRQPHEFLALALALEDDGLSDDEVVAALVTAAEGHVLRLQSAFASTLYLLEDMPLDEGAQRLSTILRMALEQSAQHEPISPEALTDTDWLAPGDDAEAARGLADRLTARTGDKEAVLRDARQLQADLERLRRQD